MGGICILGARKVLGGQRHEPAGLPTERGRSSKYKGHSHAEPGQVSGAPGTEGSVQVQMQSSDFQGKGPQ